MQLEIRNKFFQVPLGVCRNTKQGFHVTVLEWSPSIFPVIPGHYTNLEYWSRKSTSDKLVEEVEDSL